MTFECRLVQLTMTSAKTFEIITVTEKYLISFKIIFLIQKWGRYEHFLRSEMYPLTSGWQGSIIDCRGKWRKEKWRKWPIKTLA